MEIRELIHEQPVTVDEDARLESAARVMVERNIRHLPVMNGNKLVGVLSERDLLAFRGYGGLQAPVSSAMQRNVQTIDSHADVTEAAGILATRKIGCLPVLDDGQLVGVITTTDMLAFLAGERPAPPATVAPVVGH